MLSPNFGQKILFCLYKFHIWRSWHTFYILLKSDDLEILIMWNSDTLAKLHNRHFADIKTENVNKHPEEKKHRKKCECCPIHVTLWL